MTKKQLIQALKKYPNDMEVFIDTESIQQEFQYNQFSTVSTKEIGFSEIPNGLCVAKDTVIILSE